MNTKNSLPWLDFLPAGSVRFLLLPLVLLAFLFPFDLQAGTQPFTENQFPTWYAVSPQPVFLTNTTEAILFQTAVPPNIVGSLGFMRLTAILDGDAIGNNHVVTYYLGPATFTNATALATNTFKTSTATAVQTYVFPFLGGYSNRVFSTTTTNTFGLPLVNQIIAVGTQTNGLFLTVTGSNLGTTNWLALDGFIAETLQQ